MKRLLCDLTLLLAFAYPAVAGDPKPVQNEFVKIEVAGLAFANDPPHGATMWHPFMFQLKEPLTLTHVRIDDVTDKSSAILLVDDKNPKGADGHWRGNSRKLALNQENYPWMYDYFNTKRLFRVTISSKEQPEMVLTQAAAFSGREKAQIREILTPKQKSKK